MRLYRCELWDHVNLPQTQCQADRGAALAISAPEHGGSRAVIVAIAHAKRGSTSVASFAPLFRQCRSGRCRAGVWRSKPNQWRSIARLGAVAQVAH